MKPVNIKCVPVQLFIVSLVLLFFGCAGSALMNAPIDVRFVLIGNTNPDSPFTGFSEKLPQVIDMINADNPIAVIHTGSMIHGGENWMGIHETDITRQFKAFKKTLSKLTSIPYTVIGVKDLYNKSTYLYEKNMKKDQNYSFNYGNIHFIIFNTVNLQFDTVKKYHYHWLKKDLESHKQYAAIFIFTHSLGFNPASARPDDFYNKIVTLIGKYPVVAVFSGQDPRFITQTVGQVQYITAGCGGYTQETMSWYYNQYYVVDYTAGTLKIVPKKINY